MRCWIGGQARRYERAKGGSGRQGHSIPSPRRLISITGTPIRGRAVLRSKFLLLVEFVDDFLRRYVAEECDLSSGRGVICTVC